MNKTLKIELSDQRKAIANLLWRAIYKGELRYEHESHCAFRYSVEDRCDCNLGLALDVVKGEV